MERQRPVDRGALRTVLEQARLTEASEVEVVSLEAGGRYRTSLVNDRVVGDDDTVLALQVNGETLSLDHGFPVRLIAPNQPGVMQTKWVTRLVTR
ncbi:MAG: molybdopterin-dependent oxidoreductase [Ilumatobacteraceae bacterium]